jgi:hypothetical protein
MYVLVLQDNCYGRGFQFSLILCCSHTYVLLVVRTQSKMHGDRKTMIKKTDLQSTTGSCNIVLHHVGAEIHTRWFIALGNRTLVLLF